MTGRHSLRRRVVRAEGLGGWDKRSVQVAILGVLVAAAAGIGVPVYLARSHDQSPTGQLVVVAPAARFGGAAVYGVLINPQPISYLPAGEHFLVDCLQELGNQYLFAHVSAHQAYQYDWIDS